MNEKIKILCVDDEPNILSALKRLLRKGNYLVSTALNGFDALNLLSKEDFQIVISDLKMPEMNGIELLKRIKADFPEVEVVLLTAYGTIDTAVEAMKIGAADFVQKPFIEDLLGRLEKLIELKKLKQENVLLKQQLRNKYSFKNIIGKTPVMLKLFDFISKVASTESPVLIQGESGTGKELIARAIHFSGSRADKPFITVDCSSISHTVIESELFGHEKGSFTGALKSKEGLFKAAGEGTIFLDEIAEIPPNIQAKLLRAVQEREIRPVGSTETYPARARIISATNHDLKKDVEEKKFRKDLYFRINVVLTVVPPLRKRKDDIPLLVKSFIEKYNSDIRSVRNIRPEALDCLLEYHWPGNVRELENYIERALNIGTSDYLELSDLPDDLKFKSKHRALNLNGKTMADMEKEIIINALQKTNRSRKKTAAILDIGISTLYRKMKKYNIPV